MKFVRPRSCCPRGGPPNASFLANAAFVISVVLTAMLPLDGAGAQFSPGAQSAGDPYLPALGNGGYDVQHYDLTINYNPVSNTMVSAADITILATQGLS